MDEKHETFGDQLRAPGRVVPRHLRTHLERSLRVNDRGQLTKPLSAVDKLLMHMADPDRKRRTRRRRRR